MKNRIGKIFITEVTVPADEFDSALFDAKPEDDNP